MQYWEEKKGKYKMLHQWGNHKNLHLTTQELKKDDEMNYIQQRGKYVELQGEFKKLRPPMFDGEYEDATKA